MLTMHALIAQAPATPPTTPPAQPEIPFLMRPEVMLGMIALFFFVVILPGNRRAKREQADMLANIKRGAKVVTSSGIIGIVVAVKETEDEITLRSDDSKLKVLKSSVVRVLGTDDAEAAKA
jgi:preprotein translocase subunit YajC